MNKFNTLHKLALTAALLVALAPKAQAQPSQEKRVKPEISTTVWVDNKVEYASVTVNGKDILTYTSEGEPGASEDKASKLAEKIQEWLDTKHGSFEQLQATSESNLGVFKCGSETAIKFEVPDSCQNVAAASAQALAAMKDAAGIRALAQTTAIATQNGIDPEDVDTQGLSRFSGKASWYGGKFHGRRSASGERFDCNNLTAAHRTLPFGTKLLVRNKRTGASCVVKVADRGPYSHGRVIDLSMGAAKQLNMISSGVANVDVFVMN